MLFSVLNFLKCVATEVAFNNTDILQSSVATHVRCGGIFSSSIITNFLPMLSLTVKHFWKSVIFGKVKVYKNGAIFGPPCTMRAKNGATLHFPEYLEN